MQSETIRLLDRWVGILLCFLLTIFNKICSLFSRVKGEIHNPKKIIFVKLIEQGAMVLAIPALERAKQWVGKENVYACVFKKNSFVLPTLEILPKENIIEIDTSNVFRLLRDVFRYMCKCRRIKIDTAIDCEFFSRGSAIITYLSGARARVGMHGFLNDTPYRGNLMTHKVTYNPYIHTAYVYLLMVEAIKEKPFEIPLLKIPFLHEPLIIPRYVPHPERKRKWEQRLGIDPTHGKKKPYVILTPNPCDLLRVRKWPFENYFSLCEKLIQRYPEIVFVLTGFAEEREELSKFERTFGTDYFINTAGETDFEDLLTLYNLCDVLVTNDSGPAHFATTSTIGIVVLFGPETPVLFAPIGDNVHVLYTNLACSPCLNAHNYRFSFCNNNLCVQMISVDNVFEEVCKSLSSFSTTVLDTNK
ncbi:MAG TPA: glycosyltransferase family 9 protein [Candidatus Hydrogenedens sp.]|nr:glycosyltransferase family 9 protein [Candidatus Hydrogenedens sp.]HOL19247.1 glycosyltransferase family 9 protein [Candidatus Hydrogenedens sp.]HPP58926.1 glycosyltransferase family 9 protein [Candidatus Hydrogenedens sp.]